jgi:hypothetical protein
MPLKFRLRQEGIDNAGGTDLRIAPHDPCGHPLTLFPRWEAHCRLQCDYQFPLSPRLISLCRPAALLLH